MVRPALIRLKKFLVRIISHYRARIVQIMHILSAALLLSSIAFFFVYEVFYILPNYLDASGCAYKFNWLLLLYLLHNILGNILYCWGTDTSFLALPKDRQQPLATEAHLWHLCTHCNMLVPPRTFHCRVCNCCILKRDHHCNFLANCIGHVNQRYFIALLLHLILGCAIALTYNVLYLWEQRAAVLSNPNEFVGVCLGFHPLHLTMSREALFNNELNWLIFNCCVLKLNAIALILAGALLIIQLFMISRASCMHAMRDRSYDLGFSFNMRQVLGKRMLWTMLSPMVHSQLPQDGTRWQQPLDNEAKKPA
ncbi:GH23419 [Drosophila grimshawi]|uniref:Palmitoyltransferase n=1 Tax=Drosophila grimshawi TaxID=7222 RepID=B4JT35_DROGR|nr:GH23419 [Drosophila grimshawi]